MMIMMSANTQSVKVCGVILLGILSSIYVFDMSSNFDCHFGFHWQIVSSLHFSTGLWHICLCVSLQVLGLFS